MTETLTQNSSERSEEKKSCDLRVISIVCPAAVAAVLLTLHRNYKNNDQFNFSFQRLRLELFE